MLNRLWREPLAHFVLAGAALFVLFALVDGEGDAAPDRIVVTQGRIEQLAAGYARVWQRPPTSSELDGLIEDHIREEVFYRRALEMGLDRDDIIVRRRLRQKMEFLAEEVGADTQPSDAELQAFMNERADAFRLEPRIAFAQVYFRPEGGREAAAAAAARLAELSDEAAASAIQTLGDPSLLPPDFELAPVGEAARVFGEAFAESLGALELGRWSEPVESSYGWHLVRVSGRVEGRMPSLAESREAVLTEWHGVRRRESLEETHRRLRERYEVVVERPDAAAKPAGETP